MSQAAFQIVGADLATLQHNPYRAAMDFIRGKYRVEGDLLSAIRTCTAGAQPGLTSWLGGLVVRLSESRPAAWLRAMRSSAADIRFHYDRSNEFYRQFLDARMVYSCAYFHDPNEPLDAAQLAKLDLVCRKLNLSPGDRFLDIGCGWGALLEHAAARYGVQSTGCTLSHEQWRHITARRPRAVTAYELDYRQLPGRFDKVASVGMCEHVGKPGLASYFGKIAALLARDGLFLNHCIVRRTGSRPDGQSLFLQRRVFPGTALVTFPDLVGAAEVAGFEVLDVENIRPSYALTCRAWVRNLQANAEACRRLVDEETFRTWLLYLAGSAVNFEDGYMDVHQILFCRRDSRARPLTRSYLFGERNLAE